MRSRIGGDAAGQAVGPAQRLKERYLDLELDWSPHAGEDEQRDA